MQPAWTMDADAIAAATSATATAAASQSERDATSAMFQRLALEASTAGMPPAVNHIAVKLPDFWTKEPELWFMQAETTFRRVKSRAASLNTTTCCSGSLWTCWCQ
jgi:hypothetical protein